MSNAAELVQYMNKNLELRDHLAQPLRSVGIKSDLFINAECFPNSEPSFNEFSSATNWNANWKIANILSEEEDITQENALSEDEGASESINTVN